LSKTILPSGLRIVTEEVSTSRSAAVGIWANVGSRDEVKSVAGASHFLEHLLFKGTKTRTALEISSAIEAVGGEMNAFTGQEYTCFYARVIDTDLPLAVDVVTDLITSSTFTSADVDSERKVVLSEIAVRDDDPSDYIHELYLDTYYGDSPVGRSILGTVDSINKMPRNSIYNYYKKHYQPENLVVSVAGNVKHYT
jgi:predicted Zn-dependent peptidase